MKVDVEALGRKDMNLYIADVTLEYMLLELLVQSFYLIDDLK